MRRRDRESVRDLDSHDGLFFDPDPDHDAPDAHDGHDRNERHDGSDVDLAERPRDDSHDDHHDDSHDPDDDPDAGERDSQHGTAGRYSRVERRRHNRNRHRMTVMGLLALLVVIVLGISVYFIGLPIYRYVFPADYDGSGTGSVVITVKANQNTSDIGDTLAKQDVVASQRAFTDAADDDRSRNIQPGSYKLKKHMSAGSALRLLLDPSSRLDSDTVVPEGATIADVEKRLVAPSCTAAATTASRLCGLGLSKAVVTKALTNVKSLGIPTDYLPDGKTPASAEGFLFPATYTFDDKTDVTDALQQMVGKFTDQARATKFSAAAKAIGLTPYNALIIASIAQAEAKFPEDFPKVARVILNRVRADHPLQVDATSAYAAKLKGLDPTEEIYAKTQGPFNTYRNKSLPPTPIGNPGQEAMKGAVKPAKGGWMFYVNRDAAGHLGFYTDEKSFTKAQQRCHDKGWGCAAP